MKRLALAACATGIMPGIAKVIPPAIPGMMPVALGSAGAVLPISQSLKPNSVVVASIGTVPSVPSSESIAIPSVCETETGWFGVKLGEPLSPVSISVSLLQNVPKSSPSPGMLPASRLALRSAI